jgi:hypothetical protein
VGRVAFGTGQYFFRAPPRLAQSKYRKALGVYVTGVQATVLGNIAVEADGAIEALGNAATGEVGTVVVEPTLSLQLQALRVQGARHSGRSRRNFLS